MWRDGAEIRTARRTKVGAILVHAAVVATMGLASAVSGVAVALHLAAAPPAGQHLAPSRGAATGALASAAQARTADPPAIVPDSPATSPAAPAPLLATPPIAERELTFAWGYAQRHPGARDRQAEARVVPALANARTGGAATVPKSEPRRPAARQRASVAQRETVGLAPSEFFAAFDRDPYTEERRANGLRVFSRAQRRRPARATATLPSLHNHEQTRS